LIFGGIKIVPTQDVSDSEIATTWALNSTSTLTQGDFQQKPTGIQLNHSAEKAKDKCPKAA